MSSVGVVVDGLEVNIALDLDVDCRVSADLDLQSQSQTCGVADSKVQELTSLLVVDLKKKEQP